MAGLLATALGAQEVEKRIEIKRVVAGGAPAAIGLAPQATFDFIAAGPAVEGRLVKGAPFSAEGVTETTRTLADGTRIEQRSTSRVYRDSEGRTRREHTLGTLGQWTATGEAPTTVVVQDPVAGESIILDAEARTARRIKVNREVHHDEPVLHEVVTERHSGELQRHVIWREGGPAEFHAENVEIVRGDVTTASAEPVHVVAPEGAGREDLGEKNVGGVIARGTRTTSVVPAGSVGNDRDITITTEQWYSPELQVVVLRETNDPLSGDVMYRLENILRGDPPKYLFEVPAGYTVEDGGEIEYRIRAVEDHHE